jgi:hypothetical protein
MVWWELLFESSLDVGHMSLDFDGVHGDGWMDGWRADARRADDSR